jgi:hypothetical protein
MIDRDRAVNQAVPLAYRVAAAPERLGFGVCMSPFDSSCRQGKLSAGLTNG